MVARDYRGRFEPRVDNYIVKKNGSNWEIIKEGCCIRTPAVLNDTCLMWSGIEPFDSMVNAYAWLKDHVSELL